MSARGTMRAAQGQRPHCLSKRVSASIWHPPVSRSGGGESARHGDLVEGGCRGSQAGTDKGACLTA